jgi:hypothetical protein
LKNIKQRCRGQHIQLEGKAVEIFPDRERQQQNRTAAGGEANQGQLMRHRPPRHQRRIQAKRQQRTRKHHVALVEADAGKRREVAAQDDRQHADQRDDDAGELPPG